MGAILVVTRAKKQVRTFALTAGSIVIGRSEQCDLRLDDPDVSRQHATVQEENGRFTIADAGSRNGVLLNGKRIDAETEIQEGDDIVLGPFSLEFRLDEPAAGAGSNDAEPATRFISSKDLKIDLPGRKIEKKATPGRLKVKLTVLDGPLKGGAFEDWSGDLTIGRGLDNHVVLLDDAVTTYHARIFERPDGYYLEDLGSHNGTFLQGVKVTSQKLGPSAKIRIGVTTLQFRIVDLVKRKQLLLLSAAVSSAALILLLLVKLMMPGDKAATQTMKGRELFRARNFEEARKAYEKALAYDSGYQPARAALKELKAIMEADAVIERAVKATEEARFDDALNIAETAIRIAPTYRAAAKMKERIKAISEAEIAFRARNWTDAARLYKSIAADYPSSCIVTQRLSASGAELAASESLTAAQNHAQRGQLDLASNTLAGISSQSVYYAAAAQMQAAILWLDGVNRLLDSDDALTLRQTFDVLAKERDPLKAINISSEDLKGRITSRLQAISQKWIVAAKEQMRAGQLMEAFRLYERALEADPANAEAAEAAVSIRLMVRNECAVYLRDEKRYESLGQYSRAAESLKKIVATGIPGEDYYEYAKNKLTRLKP